VSFFLFCPKEINGTNNKVISSFFNLVFLSASNIINVSLTYLRDLEVAELKEEDM